MSEPDRAVLTHGGSAPYYRYGRLPYPSGLADGLAQALDLPYTGRLLDVGCGPGTVALSLARYFDGVVGVDADLSMILEAQRAAEALDVSNAQFVHVRAEALPANLGQFGLITFAQSFHWVDQRRVAAAVFRLLEPGAACAVIYGWTLRGDRAPESTDPLPPYEALDQLLESNQEGPPSAGMTPGGELDALASAGLQGPQTIAVPGGEVITVSIDALVARCLSRSGTSPDHLGGARTEFEQRARALLTAATPTGRFAERLRTSEVNLWRKPALDY